MTRAPKNLKRSRGILEGIGVLPDDIPNADRVGRRSDDIPNLTQPNAASFGRRLASRCRAGTTLGLTDTTSGRLATLLTSCSTSLLPGRLTGYWSSLRLVPGALR